MTETKEVKFTITGKGQIQAFEFRRNSNRWFRISVARAEQMVESGAKVQDPKKKNLW